MVYINEIKDSLMIEYCKNNRALLLTFCMKLRDFFKIMKTTFENPRFP